MIYVYYHCQKLLLDDIMNLKRRRRVLRRLRFFRDVLATGDQREAMKTSYDVSCHGTLPVFQGL